MNIEEYISSGVLESYVMGELPDKEMQKVQCMALVHEEIKAELHKIEEAFEQMSFDTAVSPTSGLKEKIWRDIDTEEYIEKVPVRPIRDIESIPMRSSGNNWARAAGIAALIGLSAYALYQNQQNRVLGDEIAGLQEKVRSSEEDLDTKGALLAAFEHDMSIIKDPSYTEVIMLGTDNAPTSVAKVYWNQTQKQVFLSVDQMAELPKGKTYQLWALEDGVPIDAGVFTPQDALIQMKNIAAGQTFAVTVENEGGAESPALETLQVLGNVPV